MFGKDLYYISILGTPSEKNPWMLQFGGHHLALNITIDRRARHSDADSDRRSTRHSIHPTERPSGPWVQESDKAHGIAERAGREPAETSRSWVIAWPILCSARAGWEDDSAGGPQGFEHE